MTIVAPPAPRRGRTARVDRGNPGRGTGGAAPRKHKLEEEDERGAAVAEPVAASWKKVKVRNVPPNLPERDLRNAFEASTGEILRFELIRDTAYITFSRPEDAQKAVETFDRGNLNGNCIDVEIGP
mmetsp:Transcript_40419/g.125789  ORF Transcript_40419/g.125789 Transcript_40419/m.125789 type:complete len:126 (-) Transcript_40419:62-439(-)